MNALVRFVSYGIFGVALGALATQGVSIPDRLDGPVGPLWLSAELIAHAGELVSTGATPDPQEFLRTESLDELRTRLALQISAARNKSLCDGARGPCVAARIVESGAATCFRPYNFHGGDPGPAVETARTFDGVVRHLRTVVSGTVVGSEVGFSSVRQPQGSPATLLAVRIDERLLWPDSSAIPDVVLVPYDDAPEIQIGADIICKQRRVGWPAPPVVGARIVIFTEFEPIETSGGIVIPTDVAGADLAWETPAGLATTTQLARKGIQFREQDFNVLKQALWEAVNSRAAVRR